jgi:arylsulfatase A-like enzyme
VPKYWTQMRLPAIAIVAIVAGSGACSGSSGDGQANAAPGRGAKATAASPRHDVFSLVDNRLLAHAQRGGGILLPAGSGGFAKYLPLREAKPSWKLRQTADGARVSTAAGTAALRVPLTAAQADAAGDIALRVKGGGARVSVRVNGAAAGEAALGPGWQVARVAAPAGTLRAGENAIELRFAKPGAAVEWIQVGGTAPDDALAAPGDTLRLARDEALAYYIFVPEGARLDGAVAGDGCAIDVAAARADGAAVAGALPRVDLSALAGSVARVELTARGCDAAVVQRAALTVPGPAPALPAERGPPPKHVVLWIMDTLRADRLRPFAPDARAEAPAWEALAKTGAVFADAYAQGNESQASHASVWTAAYPVRHGIAQSEKFGQLPKDKDAPLLGRLLKRAGFYNTGITANGFVTEWTGYAHGFDAFRNLMRDGHGKRYNGRVPSEWLVEAAVKSLDGRQTEPWLLFLGTIDNHKPWIGYEPWLSKYDPDYKGKFQNKATADMLGMVQNVRGCVDKPADRDVQRILAIYDSDVSYQDDWVGKLRAQLEDWAIADDTMIILTADHGEELWEHGRCGHGFSLHETLVRVPLLIHYPPLIPPVVVREGTETMDILPTVLDALGEPIPDALQGESLIPIAHGVGGGYPRAMMSTIMQGRGVAMRVGAWKLSVTRKGAALYDVVADPDEREDRADERPLEYRFVADAMGVFLANQSAWSKRSWGVASNMRPAAPVDLGW